VASSGDFHDQAKVLLSARRPDYQPAGTQGGGRAGGRAGRAGLLRARAGQACVRRPGTRAGRGRGVSGARRGGVQVVNGASDLIGLAFGEIGRSCPPPRRSSPGLNTP
jgi:hypothetical protein